MINTQPGKLRAAILAALASTLVAGLAQAQNEVEELVVYGTRGDLNSVTGSRLDLTVLETPGTVNVIDGDAIRARGETSVLDAIVRDSGFNNEGNPGNGHSSLGARGFNDSVTKLIDGTNYFSVAGTMTFPLDTWNVERIEVLKGPASVFYGEGGIGGAINIVTRRPEFEPSGEARVMVGQDSTTFVGLDYTTGLTENVAVRADVSRSQSDNWLDNSDSEAHALSLALLWRVNDDFSLTARVERSDQEPMKYFGSPVDANGFIRDFVGMNFNVGDAEVSYVDDSFRLQADWTISDAASLEANFYQLKSDRFWKNSEYYYYDAGSVLLERLDPLILSHDVENRGFRSNLTLNPADSRLKTSIGFEINDIDLVRTSNYGPANPNPIDWSNDFDVVDPYNFQPGVMLDLTDAQPMLDLWGDVSQWAVFGEAQYRITDRFSLVGALRYDDTETRYNRLASFNLQQAVDVVTGRIGAVYDLNETTALYGQYGTGAEHPSGSITTVSGSYRQADMVETEQIEVGIKNILGNTGLQWSLAVFDITKKNLIEDDPDSADPNDVIVVPEQTSRGIELGLNYALTNNLQLHGNLTALKAEDDNGETPNGVPETTWNLGLVWYAMEDLRVVADARHMDERKHSSTQPLPDYNVVDVSLSWEVNDNLSLMLKGDNIFDELYASASYWSGTWLVGKRRTFSIGVDYSF